MNPEQMRIVREMDEFLSVLIEKARHSPHYVIEVDGGVIEKMRTRLRGIVTTMVAR